MLLPSLKKIWLALIITVSFLDSFVATSFDFGRTNSHSISMHGVFDEPVHCDELLSPSEDLRCSSEASDTHREHGLCQTILGLLSVTGSMLEPVADPVRPGEFNLRRLRAKLSDGGPGEPPKQ